ncbi:MAG: hypothetical protein H6741_35590 [Alphaproteobacteria bacterium]|nr:hypothetical protein [Alphaproteobacteria bacterium]MCB9798032.1 hypothetical protein [Alphaproteobacteria bacterium]
MRARVVLIPLLTSIALALSLEGVARVMHLDARQRQAIRVERSLLIANMPGAAGAALGVDFLPRGFSLDAEGFTSVWGRCDYAYTGRSLLVFGDSVTRQVDLPPGPGHLPDDPNFSWPSLLVHTLPGDWQLCVIAEDGYHPSDYAALARIIAPALEPALTLVQLCENDLVDLIPPVAEPLPDGGVALYSPISAYLAYAPLYEARLFAASEAFRFLHWRLQAQLGQTREVPTTPPGRRPLSEALQALDALGAQIFYVPALLHPPQAPSEPSWANVTRSGVSVTQLALPPPLTRLRHAHDDPVHLNHKGHAAVAEAVQAQVLAPEGR